MVRRTLRRNWSSERTWIGVPNVRASSTASHPSTHRCPSRIERQSSIATEPSTGTAITGQLWKIGWNS